MRGASIIARLVPLVGIACAVEPRSPPTPSSTTVSRWFDSDGDHLVEIVRLGDVLYATNSNDSLAGARLLDDGGIEILFSHLDAGVRCTTADLHAASGTVVCANEYDGLVYRFSTTDPSAPTLVGSVAIAELDPDPVRVSDIHVRDDEVWLAAYGAGLWRAPIDGNGELGAFESVAVPGNVRKLEHVDERLVALVGELGLLVFEPDAERPGGWIEAGRLTLDGPPIDLAVDSGRAVVGLGSAGAAVVDLETLEIVARVEPQAVVASVALRGDRLAVGTLSGVFVYAIEPEADARLIAYTRAGDPERPRPASVLDLAFEADDELIVTDWYVVHRISLDEDGVITDLESPTGIYRAPTQAITIPIRNHGQLEIGVELWLFDRKLGAGIVDPGHDSTIAVELEPAELDAQFPADSTVRIDVRRFAPNGAALGVARLLVVTTAADHDPTQDGKPAPGMGFPPIQLATSLDPLELPGSAGPRRVIFFTEDCQAMWIEVQDAAWLWRRGESEADAAPIFATNGPLGLGPPGSPFAARLEVEDVEAGYYENAGAEIDAFNQPLVPIYERGFAIDRLESAAAHPTDYLIDGDGQVLAVEREYRGRFPLRSAP